MVTNKTKQLARFENSFALNAAKYIIDYSGDRFFLPKELSYNSGGQVLYDLYSDVYNRLYVDTYPNKEKPKSQYIWSFVTLVEGIYMRSGKLRKNVTVEELSFILAQFYSALCNNVEGRNSVLALRVFVVLIARSVGKKIDLRRLDQKAVARFLDKGVTVSEMKQLFRIAFTKQNSASKDMVEVDSFLKQPKIWQSLSDYYVCDKSGWTCPLYTRKEDGVNYIVMSNGGLWPLEVCKEMSLDTLSLRYDQIRYYLPSVKMNDGAGRQNVVSYHNKNAEESNLSFYQGPSDCVRPYRLWVDKLTGLSIGHDNIEGELEVLLDLYNEFKLQCNSALFNGDERDVLKLPLYIKPFLEFILQKGVKNFDESRLYSISASINALKIVIENNVDKKFSCHKPVQEPNYYVTMGGSAAGKEILISRAVKECSGNVVIASLDQARKFFEDYFGGVGGGLDYPQLDLAARIARKMILHRAIKENYHVIRDCSGVPAIREMKFIELAKYAKIPRKTCVYAITADIEQSLERSMKRYHKTGRWLDPKILVEKHIRVSREAIVLMRCSHVDYFVLYDNSADEGSEEIILETQIVDDQRFRLLRENYYVFLLENSKRADGTYKVAIIYDVDRYLYFLEKGLLNEQAKCPEQLVLCPFVFMFTTY